MGWELLVSSHVGETHGQKVLIGVWMDLDEDALVRGIVSSVGQFEPLTAVIFNGHEGGRLCIVTCDGKAKGCVDGVGLIASLDDMDKGVCAKFCFVLNNHVPSAKAEQGSEVDV